MLDLFRNKIIQGVVVIFLIVFFSSCTGNKAVTILSQEEEFLLTIKEDNESRTIFFTNSTKENYVVIDKRTIDQVTDGVFVCPTGDNGKLEVINPGVKIIELKLDTTEFEFKTMLPLKGNGLPDVLHYHQNECFEFNFLRKSVFPKNKAILK